MNEPLIIRLIFKPWMLWDRENKTFLVVWQCTVAYLKEFLCDSLLYNNELFKTMCQIVFTLQGQNSEKNITHSKFHL